MQRSKSSPRGGRCKTTQLSSSSSSQRATGYDRHGTTKTKTVPSSDSSSLPSVLSAHSRKCDPSATGSLWDIGESAHQTRLDVRNLQYHAKRLPTRWLLPSSRNDRGANSYDSTFEEHRTTHCFNIFEHIVQKIHTSYNFPGVPKGILWKFPKGTLPRISQKFLQNSPRIISRISLAIE